MTSYNGSLFNRRDQCDTMLSLYVDVKLLALSLSYLRWARIFYFSYIFLFFLSFFFILIGIYSFFPSELFPEVSVIFFFLSQMFTSHGHQFLKDRLSALLLYVEKINKSTSIASHFSKDKHLIYIFNIWPGKNAYK